MIAMLLLKATVVLGLAALAQAFMGPRLSAAARHWVWTLAVGALLALPLAARALPAWTVAVPVAPLESPAGEAPPAAAAIAAPPSGPVSSEAIPSDAADPAAPAAAVSPLRWPAAAFGLYAIGVVLLLARLAVQQVAVRRLVARAEDVQETEWTALLQQSARAMGVRRHVRLRRAFEDVMPMTAGLWRPAILVPSMADDWTAERRRAVLLHELAHVARHDCLTQMLAGIACAIYWPHPGVWWAARRLRVERELACDDLVLEAGTEARDYAGHLLEIAYSLGGHRAPAIAVSMARPGQLEGRMLAVLDAARNRAIPGLRGRLAGAAAAVAIVMPLAAVAASTMPLATDMNLTSARESDPTDADIVAPPATPAEVAGATDATPATAHDEGQEHPAAGRGAGTWEVSPAKKAGYLYLQMREDRSSSGTTVPLSQLEGLSQAQMGGSGSAVRFAVRRDAGTFDFEGTFRSGVGGGTYTFSPNPAFAPELQKRGVGAPSAAQQQDMARHDVGLALVDELAAHGYQRPTIADLIKAGHHGVRLEFVREMAQLGYRLGTVEALVRLRDHGVTPEYVRGMAAEGLPKLTADELVTTRDHGVTPEYSQQLRQFGYANLGVEGLVRARDHGVTPEFVKGLADFGYAKLPIEQVIKARDHGVTPEFVKALGDAGYSKLPLDQVVNARDHGVTPEYLKGLAALGFTNLTLDQVINARDHGVTPEFGRELRALGYQASLAELVNARDHGVTPGYARELKALGYDNVPLAELVKLRDHGVTPERVKRANERAGTKLPLDMVRSLVDGGSL